MRTSFAAIAGPGGLPQLEHVLGAVPYRPCTIACIVTWPGVAEAALAAG